MKQTYTTPAITMSGSVVVATRDSTGGLIENAGFQKKAGSVGFNL
jgi:hypothetical protein